MAAVFGGEGGDLEVVADGRADGNDVHSVAENRFLVLLESLGAGLFGEGPGPFGQDVAHGDDGGVGPAAPFLDVFLPHGSAADNTYVEFHASVPFR